MTKDPEDNDWFVESEGADDPGSATFSEPKAGWSNAPDMPEWEWRAYLKGWNDCFARMDQWDVIDDPLTGVSPSHVNEIPKNEHVPPLVLTGDPMLDRLRARGMHTEADEIARLRQQLADARTILNTAPAQTWVQALRNKLEE